MNLCRWFAVYLSLRFNNMPCEHSSVKIYVFKSHAHKYVKYQFRMLKVYHTLSDPCFSFVSERNA